MELNAEQIKKALGYCKSPKLTKCDGCPRENEDGQCMYRLNEDALALITSQEQRIKELTEGKTEIWEERNRIYNDLQDWKEIAKQYQKQFEDCAEDRARLTEENERLKATKYMAHSDGRLEMIPTVESVKADTVKKMQAEIEARCINGGIYPAFVARTIDQIAKEMLEEG
jgi:hypothetical protein